MAAYTRKPLGAFLLVLALSSMATAQDIGGVFPVEINTEQNPQRNLSGAALAARSPGNMVTAGLARTQVAMNFARGIIDITEPLAGPDPKASFLSEAITIIFEQLNRTLLYLGNILLERAGLSPLLPSDETLPDTGTVDEGDVNAGDEEDVVRVDK